ESGGRSLAASASAKFNSPVSESPADASAHPTTPPPAPINNATTASNASAVGLTRRPNNTSGKLNNGPVGRSTSPSARSCSRKAAAPSTTGEWGSRHGADAEAHGGPSSASRAPPPARTAGASE